MKKNTYSLKQENKPYTCNLSCFHKVHLFLLENKTHINEKAVNVLYFSQYKFQNSQTKINK